MKSVSLQEANKICPKGNNLNWFLSWQMSGITLLFSLGWICSPAQLIIRICNM
ncbi:MAG: hypothetical protein J6S87_09050 [Bacteroidales bacterium]|nr:hypothetical protein [Bacteroidales bacterium]